MAQNRLLFFGTIRRNKGLDLLLNTLEKLPQHRLTIAGEAREADYFHNEVMPRVQDLRKRGLEIDVIDRFVPESEVACSSTRIVLCCCPIRRISSPRAASSSWRGTRSLSSPAMSAAWATCSASSTSEPRSTSQHQTRWPPPFDRYGMT